ncbi:PRC-barrel domain containing protein [Methylobacterium durans]|uniref:PRC-barrel domain containing protein n=1 Tax=Methylobacterium durans TaxID=2202825 RepID=UPI001F1A0818|nr:PRC-barrel domain containing protein [Methylobacterium durans]
MTAIVLVADGALAQAIRSTLADRVDSTMQMSAASLMPTLRGRWLYADNGLAVGRVREIRVASNGNTLVAIVARRRWLGGGEIGVPVPSLRQVGNDLVVSGTRSTIRAMPSL